MSYHYNSPWTDEKEQELIKLTAEHWSAGKIAEKLNVTRCAVLGKQHRLGISSGGAVDPIRRFYPAANWTAQEEEQLRTMVAAGESLTKIAQQLGKTCGAISGKQQRLGIARSRPRNNGATIAALKAAFRRKPKISEFIPVSNVTPIKIGFMDLKEHHCRYPLDERGDDGLMLFCGRQVVKGHSWCAGHGYGVYNEFVCQEAAE